MKTEDNSALPDSGSDENPSGTNSDRKKNHGSGGRLLWIIVLFITIIASSCSAFAQQESRGFDTPAKCAQAVFEALQIQDVSAIEACFAIPEMARLFDYQKYCERLNAVMGLYYYMPSNTELGVAYNEAALRSSLYSQIIFSSALLTDWEYGEKVNSRKTYAPLDDDANAIISFLETPSTMEGFSRLTLDLIATPDAFPELGEKFSSEFNTRGRINQMSMWLVDDNVELVLIASAPNSLLSDDMIIIPLRFVQIDGKWLADPTGSNFRSILGISTFNLFTLLSEIQ